MRSGLQGALVALVLAVSAGLPGIPAVSAAVDPALQSASHSIVRVAPGQAEAVAGFARRTGAMDVQVLDSLDMVTAQLDAATVDALSRNVAVKIIGADGEIAATGGDPNRRGPRSVASSNATYASIGVLEAWRESTGNGVTVALMDSGIAYHPAFGDRVLARVDFLDDGALSADPAGHGTFLAGLIAGKTATFTGVAPDANLVSLRVLDRQGRGTVRGALRAVDWVLQNRRPYGIRVVNVSFGATQTRPYHGDPLAASMESLWFAGVVVVAAAGNDGLSAGSISTPGADPFVVTVGAFDDKGSMPTADDQEAEFSSRGPTLDGFAKPDLLAPGVDVVSIHIVGSAFDARYPERGAWNALRALSLGTMSGTSVSTALVSGIAALVLSERPSYRPTDVKGALVAGARHVAGWSAPVPDALRSLHVRPARVNAGLKPSGLLVDLVGDTWGENVTWENITWENITWENITWESVTWESVTWEAVTWEAITWEAITWE